MKDNLDNHDKIIDQMKTKNEDSFGNPYSKIPEKPRFSFSTKLNKIVLGNQEAMWVLSEIAKDPNKLSLLDNCPLELDNAFKKELAKRLKLIRASDVTQLQAREWIKQFAKEAFGIVEQVDDHAFQMFMVDINNPDNINNMAGVASKKRNKYTHVTKLNEGYDAPEV
tara:strand:+ start:211 stop:711 length:501 start_codon:yes stop_codon:yes gene_type:complete